jgi:AbrB family looped-hinge helix DNA binding protein
MTKLGRGKHMFGTVKVGERGQMVIPKDARNMFGIEPGDLLLVVGDEERGIGLAKAEKFKRFALNILESLGEKNEG